MIKKVLHRAGDRGHANHGWLNAHHSFSFANYHDPEKVHFGMLRVLNDDIIAEGMGFGMHPHDNMEIVTIPLTGDLQHKDSMGNSEVIRQFDVQVMSAGTGVHHSEFNPNPDKATNLLQLWVFPKIKNIPPRYNQKTYKPENRVNKFDTVVSPDKEATDSLWINQDAWFSLGSFETGKEVSYESKRVGNGAYLFLIEGSIEIEGEVLTKRDAIGLADFQSTTFKVLEKAELLIVDVPMN